MISKTEQTSTTFHRERKSCKCPVCFKCTSCPHAELLINASGMQKPFIGIYNRKVYDLAKIPQHQLDLYQRFITNQIQVFTQSLTMDKLPFEWSGYKGLLMSFFYDPIVEFAKDCGFLSGDFVLAIKTEKNLNNINNTTKNNNNSHDDVMEDDDVVSVDLGAAVEDDDDDEQLLPPNNTSFDNTTPTTPKTSSASSKRKSTSKQRSDLPQPLYKKAAIKKASTKKQSNIQNLAKNNKPKNFTQTICLNDRITKERRALKLREQDFESVERFEVGIRRELQLNCGFKFENLKFKHPLLKKSITVKKSEMGIIADCVREGKHEILSFHFGQGRDRKMKLSDSPNLSTCSPSTCSE